MTATTAGDVGAEAAETPVERAEHAHACANCGTHLQGAFCHACGQKGHLHGRLWHLVEEFAEGIAHFDGRIWRTLPLLAFNPGRLSREWRAGKRARYVAPLHVFMFAVFLLFLIPNFTGRHLFSPPSAASVAAAQAEAAEEGVAVQVNGADVTNATPAWVKKLSDYFEAKSENSEYYAYKIETLAYKLSFVLIPIQVAILALLMIGKWRFTLYDHSVVALYGTGFLALIWALVTALPSGWSENLGGLLFLVGAPLHAVVHLRGAYELNWFGAVGRGALLGVLSSIGFSLFVFGVVALGLAG